MLKLKKSLKIIIKHHARYKVASKRIVIIMLVHLLRRGFLAPFTPPPHKKIYFSLAVIHSAANYLYVG